MFPSTVESDVRTIVAAETRKPCLADLSPSTKVSDMEFNLQRLMNRLGLGPEHPEATKLEKIGDLSALLAAKGDDVRRRIWECATQARVTRLLQGTLLSAGGGPKSNEGETWWREFATQVLWWYARQEMDKGLDLIQRRVPTRAAQILNGVDLLGVDILAKRLVDDAGIFRGILERLGYSEEAMLGSYDSLTRIAHTVMEDYGGKIQRLVRRYANEMVDEISGELLSGFEDPSFLREAVQAWISITTGLPIRVWSPSTTYFLQKFPDIDGSDGRLISAEMLLEIADELELNLVTVDQFMAQFVEGLCRSCDMDNREHQFCAKRFAQNEMWQVECPARPALAWRYFGVTQ